jgi:hypothetical protein
MLIIKLKTKQMKSFIATVASIACFGQVSAFDFQKDIIAPIQEFHKTIDFPLTAPEAVKRHKKYYKGYTKKQEARISRNGHHAHIRVNAQRERLGFPKLNYYRVLHETHHNRLSET